MLIDDLMQILRDLAIDSKDDKVLYDYFVSLGVTTKKMIESDEIIEIDEADEEMIIKIQTKRNEDYDND
ncbi:hypothetical protein ETI08_03640 [Macrococcoides goetzii]|nr:hypothetical protein [Macrococcus goetzii]TDM48244.1 hypothetical protein ETI08_03640 [Macrococcus goetzii]